MLKTHFDAVEKSLLATAQIPANSGHPLHKGTPREAFVKEFLQGHLSERVAIGTGEIIDASSKPGESRNQNDIVVFKRDFPKLDFGGGVNGLLCESVVATIEVKSLLTQNELLHSCDVAKRLKSLVRNASPGLSIGYTPPAMLNFVVAYDGPASMKTVHGWLPTIREQLGIQYPQWGMTSEERIKIAAPAIDAVFVLGKGFLYFDNAAIGVMTDSLRAENPSAKWVLCDGAGISLLLLFLMLTQAVSGLSAIHFNLVPYLANAAMPPVVVGSG